jgi:hypothetical protein
LEIYCGINKDFIAVKSIQKIYKDLNAAAKWPNPIMTDEQRRDTIAGLTWDFEGLELEYEISKVEKLYNLGCRRAQALSEINSDYTVNLKKYFTFRDLCNFNQVCHDWNHAVIKIQDKINLIRVTKNKPSNYRTFRLQLKNDGPKCNDKNCKHNYFRGQFNEWSNQIIRINVYHFMSQKELRRYHLNIINYLHMIDSCADSFLVQNLKQIKKIKICST